VVLDGDGPKMTVIRGGIQIPSIDVNERIRRAKYMCPPVLELEPEGALLGGNRVAPQRVLYIQVPATEEHGDESR